MTDAPNLRGGTGWRTAAWGLRVIGPGLAVVAIGLLGLMVSTGVGQTVLAVGMAIYLVAVVIIVVGSGLIYRDAPAPRPNFIELRWSLLRDAAHRSSASVDAPVAPPGPP